MVGFAQFTIGPAKGRPRWLNPPAVGGTTMSKKIEIDPSILANLTRRAVLSSSMGLGIIAAAKLLGGARSLAKDAASAGAPNPQSGPNLASLAPGHFPARANRVVDIHINDPVSQ